MHARCCSSSLTSRRIVLAPHRRGRRDLPKRGRRDPHGLSALLLARARRSGEIEARSPSPPAANPARVVVRRLMVVRPWQESRVARVESHNTPLLRLRGPRRHPPSPGPRASGAELRGKARSGVRPIRSGGCVSPGCAPPRFTNKPADTDTKKGKVMTTDDRIDRLEEALRAWPSMSRTAMHRDSLARAQCLAWCRSTGPNSSKPVNAQRIARETGDAADPAA